MLDSIIERVDRLEGAVSALSRRARQAGHLLTAFAEAQQIFRVLAQDTRSMSAWYRSHGQVLVEAKRALGEGDAVARMRDLGDVWERISIACASLSGDRHALERLLILAGERTPSERPHGG